MPSKFEEFKANAKLSTDSHAGVDVDGDANSIHHTLGGRSDQAAPGNHKHSSYVTKEGVTSPGTDLPNVPQNKSWTQLTVVGPIVHYKGRASITAPFGGTAFLSLPIPGATSIGTGAFAIIGQGLWIRQGVTYVPTQVFMDTNTGTYSRAAFFTINPVGYVVEGAAPHTWQAGDSVGWDVTYTRNIP